MGRTIFVVAIVIYHVYYVTCSNVKFEAILNNATECGKPAPPYAKKRTFLASFAMRQHKKKTLLSGKYKVLVPMPFNNYSVYSFAIDASGKQQITGEIDKLNCRTWMGKIFLVTAAFRYSKKDCHIEKGIYEFKDFDVDKASHTVPSWHAAGKTLYRAQMVQGGFTVFCIDVLTTIREFD